MPDTAACGLQQCGEAAGAGPPQAPDGGHPVAPGTAPGAGPDLLPHVPWPACRPPLRPLWYTRTAAWRCLQQVLHFRADHCWVCLPHYTVTFLLDAGLAFGARSMEECFGHSFVYAACALMVEEWSFQCASSWPIQGACMPVATDGPPSSAFSSFVGCFESISCGKSNTMIYDKYCKILRTCLWLEI